ncbi:MAG: hypothetical protein AAF556_05060, partial [Pseudomonadota bacterium]
FCRAEAVDPRVPLMRMGLSGVILIGSTTSTKETGYRGESPRLGAPLEPVKLPETDLPTVNPHAETVTALPPSEPANTPANTPAIPDLVPADVSGDQPAPTLTENGVSLPRIVPIPTPRPELSEEERALIARTPSAIAGPFRAGMRTSFSNAPRLTFDMAASMNLVYDRLRAYGFSRNASLAWTLHGIHESEGGTIFTQIGGGDGVGFFQLSGWRGGGGGSFTAQLQKPSTDRNWERADFQLDEDATDQAADRERVLLNSAGALVQLLARDGDEAYWRLYSLSRDTRRSIQDMADRSTRDFIRPGAVSYTRRARDIVRTYTRNQEAIDANTDAFEAARAPYRTPLTTLGNVVPLPTPRPPDWSRALVAEEKGAQRPTPYALPSP